MSDTINSLSENRANGESRETLVERVMNSLTSPVSGGDGASLLESARLSMVGLQPGPAGLPVIRLRWDSRDQRLGTFAEISEAYRALDTLASEISGALARVRRRMTRRCRTS